MCPGSLVTTGRKCKKRRRLQAFAVKFWAPKMPEPSNKTHMNQPLNHTVRAVQRDVPVRLHHRLPEARGGGEQEREAASNAACGSLSRALPCLVMCCKCTRPCDIKSFYVGSVSHLDVGHVATLQSPSVGGLPLLLSSHLASHPVCHTSGHRLSSLVDLVWLNRASKFQLPRKFRSGSNLLSPGVGVITRIKPNLS